MRYLGGKAKSAAEIAPLIQPAGGVFVSLFCGAVNVESLVAPAFQRVILNDAHPYLIACLRAVQHGWEPPDVLTEDEYYYIKAHKDEDPALAGFVGFACSFGGKWFAGYARGTWDKGHDYADQGRRFLLCKMATLMDAEILCGDYRDVPIPPGAVVYCDPPYAGVQAYKGVQKFDHGAFWDYMRRLSREGHAVYISEMSAPEDFRPIWEKEVWRSANAKSQFVAAERLYVYNG